MKKLFPLFLIICLFMTSCQLSNHKESVADSISNPVEKEEIRGIWISCYDHISAENKTETEYKSETDKMFSTIKDTGFNTAFVHLRAFSDAFYESEIYPYSSYIAGKEGAELPFDPFEILLESAKKHGISVHGWINPFRISTNNNPDLLSDSNPAKTILQNDNSDSKIIILPNGIYYNPAHTENHKRIIGGVREIISKYDIDGIHIDDYFYPSTDECMDRIQYSEYTSKGGNLSLSEWRIEIINSFVSGLYSAVKFMNNNLIFSISPAAQIDKNRYELYADCSLWLSQKGYADMIIPQIYFGFEHGTNPFDRLLNQWSSMKKHPDIQLLCGLAAYKIGTEDEFAGAGRNEWNENSDILSRQINLITNNEEYNGFVIFSYSDITRTDCINEMKKTEKIC